jgi:hypothetical protein
MLVRLPPVLFSLSSLSVSSVKLRILLNFTLYLRNTWSLNLRAIESCVCSIRSIERKMRSILRTVSAGQSYFRKQQLLVTVSKGQNIFFPLQLPLRNGRK